jgi:hypothetical protein
MCAVDKIYENVKHRWQDGVNFLLGVWLIASPWVLGFTGVKYASANAAVLGVVAAVMALWALIAFQEWEEWVTVALGLWIVATPWLFGFAATAFADATQGAFVATWNFIVVGLLVGGLAAWSNYNMRSGGGHMAV